MAIKMEDAKGQQRSDDAGDAQCSPEEAESDWQFTTSVKVREPKDQIWNETTLKRLAQELFDIVSLTSRMPSNALVKRNCDLLCIAAWLIATIDQRTI